MSPTTPESSTRSKIQAAILVLLFLGMALALTGNVYQFVKTERLSRDLAVMQRSMQTQITRLSDATSGAFDVTQQRFQEVKQLQDSNATALTDARAELRRSNSEFTAKLEEKNQELARQNRDLAAQLAALKQDAVAKFQKTSTGLQTTTAKLDATAAKLDRLAGASDTNRAELKRIATDVAAIRTTTAATAPSAPKRPPVLRESTDHRVPFDLVTTKVPTRIGDIQIAIVSTDIRKNGYTMDLYSDDKIARDSAHMVNEPVQIYVAGHTAPYEIVVTEVRKDEVIGYVGRP